MTPRAAVDCAITATEHVLDGAGVAYACVVPLVTAPRSAFGGFCFFNNVAIAAQPRSARESGGCDP
jgi:acetoin utilization deacetylase AcuC-like enzyme